MPSLRSWKDTVAVAGLGGLALLFLWEVASMAGVPVARDMQLFFLPQKRIVWEALQSGDLPLWTPLISEGRPLLANFQSAFFYPPTWLYGAFPFLLAFNWLLVFHVVLGGAGTYLFARRIDFDRWASVTAGAAFMLGGYFASLTNLLNVLQAAAWTPMLAFALLTHLDRGSAASFAGLVVAHLLAFLAGEPTTFVLAAAVAAGFAAVWIGRTDQVTSGYGFLAASLAGGALVVAGLAAVQVLPTLEYVANSTRASGLPWGEVVHYTLEPLRLFEIAVPPDYGDPVYRYGLKSQLWPKEPWLFSVYGGIVVLVLAVCAWRDRERRREVGYWTAVAAAGILLGLGPHTPVYELLYDHLPGFSSFRYPERFYLFTGFGLALLAAHGAAGVRRRPENGRAEKAVVLCGLSAALAAKIAWTAGTDVIYRRAPDVLGSSPFVENFPYAYAAWTDSLDHALVFLVLAVVVIGLHRRTEMSSSVLAGMLFALVVLDLGLAHRSLTPVVDPSFYRHPPAVMEAVDEDELRTRYRIRTKPFTPGTETLYGRRELALETKKWLWQQTMQPNLAQYWGLLSHAQPDAIHLPREVDRSRFLDMLPLRDRLRLLRIAGVKYVYSAARFRSEAFVRGQPLDTVVPGAVYTFGSPVPRAHLAEEAVWKDEGLETLNEVLKQEFDPHRSVALLAPDTGVPRRTAGAGSSPGPEPGGEAEAGRRPEPDARIVSDTGEEIEVRVAPEEESHLVLADTHYPGWTATVDGEERPIRLANYFYRAVRVEPGDSRVVFRYRSAAFDLGKKVSIATLLVLVLGLGAWRLRAGPRSGAGTGAGP